MQGDGQEAMVYHYLPRMLMNGNRSARSYMVDRFVQPQTREDRAEKGMKTRHIEGNVHLPEDDLSALQFLFLMKTVLRSQDHKK